MSDDPLGAVPVEPPIGDDRASWLKVIDFYRDMAARFAGSRDELKHRNRALEAELLTLRAKLDRSEKNVRELVKSEEVYRATEQHMLRKLSRVLTGGNAGTWDEVERAAESAEAERDTLQRHLDNDRGRLNALRSVIAQYATSFEASDAETVERLAKCAEAAKAKLSDVRVLADEIAHDVSTQVAHEIRQVLDRREP